MQKLSAVAVLVLAFAASAAAQDYQPPRLTAARAEGTPVNVQSGGIAALELAIDARGNVKDATLVQDVAPYGAALQADARGWTFEAARSKGMAVPDRVLLIAFFRPPVLSFAAPENPRYKQTQAPAELPWPTAVTAPPFPPNVLGDGKVLLEVDVSAEGAVSGVRNAWPGSAFDSAAEQTARAWRFRPATRDGKPAAARVFMLFSFAGVS
jgi:TonB family protein